jgi:hypothetical protein
MQKPQQGVSGWDAKMIAYVARHIYRSYTKMFIEEGWPERGTKMMPAAGKRICEKYGSIENFAKAKGILL